MTLAVIILFSFRIAVIYFFYWVYQKTKMSLGPRKTFEYNERTNTWLVTELSTPPYLLRSGTQDNSDDEEEEEENESPTVLDAVHATRGGPSYAEYQELLSRIFREAHIIRETTHAALDAYPRSMPANYTRHASNPPRNWAQRVSINIPSNATDTENITPENACIICMCKKKVVAATPCGHMIYCIKCTRTSVQDRYHHCPLCRQQVSNLTFIFS